MPERAGVCAKQAAAHKLNSQSNLIVTLQTTSEAECQLRADYRGDQPTVQSSERSGCLLQLKTSLMAVSPSDSLN